MLAAPPSPPMLCTQILEAEVALSRCEVEAALRTLDDENLIYYTDGMVYII